MASVRQQRDSINAHLAGAGVIVLLGVLAYLPALPGGFIWDDDSWTTGILPLVRDFAGLEKMWFQATALQQYYPLTGTSFWIDYHLWGFHTLPYHIENLSLHLTSALLFWTSLKKLRVPGSWLAGAIFAVHPVMVESVAWITERKNVLSMVCFLLALLAYGRFSQFWREEKKPKRDWRAWSLALVLFVCALLAKTTAFALPAVLLLICWWKRGEIRLKRDVLPTLPFFVISIIFCVATGWLEKNHVGAKGPAWDISFPARCLIAGRVIWFYVGKLVWPSSFCFVYPRWHVNVASWKQWLLPISVVAIIGALWHYRRRVGRGPLTAVLFFIGTLFPALGFMNAYYMCFSFVCDHWTYLSTLGLIALTAALAVTAADRFKIRPALYAVSALLLPLLAVLTWRQCHAYGGMEDLWRDTLAKNPDAWLAHNNLGVLLSAEGKTAEAVAHYQATIRLDPDFEQAYNNMGIVYAQAGKTQEAISQYAEALRLNPQFAEAEYNWGIALQLAGRDREAIPHYERAIELQHDFSKAEYNLGLIFVDLGNIPEAIERFKAALNIDPDYADAHYDLGLALAKQGKLDEAIAHWQRTLQLQPNYPEAEYNWGFALQQMGRNDEAIPHYQQTIRLKPDFFDAQYNLGQLLLQSGKIDEGISHLQAAVRIKPDSAPAHNTLAFVLWQTGRAKDAIAQWNLALQYNPDYSEAQNALAWLLATLSPADGGDPTRAVSLARRACELSRYQVAGYVDTLATAYAAAQQFDQAIATAKKAIDLARAAGQSQLVREIQARLQSYEDRHRYMQPPPVVQSQPAVAGQNP